MTLAKLASAFALLAAACTATATCDWSESLCREECAKSPDAGDCLRRCYAGADDCRRR